MTVTLKGKRLKNSIAYLLLHNTHLFFVKGGET